MDDHPRGLQLFRDTNLNFVLEVKVIFTGDHDVLQINDAILASCL
jgi:hypothetical protein